MFFSEKRAVGGPCGGESKVTCLYGHVALFLCRSRCAAETESSETQHQLPPPVAIVPVLERRMAPADPLEPLIVGSTRKQMYGIFPEYLVSTIEGPNYLGRLIFGFGSSLIKHFLFSADSYDCH